MSLPPPLALFLPPTLPSSTVKDDTLVGLRFLSPSSTSPPASVTGSVLSPYHATPTTSSPSTTTVCINLQPLVVDSFQIYAGQRYSVILTANQPVGNYWVRALSSSGPTSFDGGLNSAILRYAGAPNADPTTNSTLVNPMYEYNLHPLVASPALGSPVPGGVDVALNLAITFDFTSLTFSVNGAQFVPPSNLPVLLQIMSGASTAASLLPAGSVYTLPPNKVIEISIPGGAVGAPHPFHLHGHAFSVIRSANSSTYNYVNPVQRDVVSTGLAGDNVTIRFRTDNAGPWIMHWCVALRYHTYVNNH
ncbi:Acyl-coenzyme A oxidase 2 [Blastosporella zonata]|nr:Acyl-coenzyme A oxidase 2 [Blastosporella zonata]